MDKFIKAVTEDVNNTLYPVYKEAFRLKPKDEVVDIENLQKIAREVNRKLGYELFEEFNPSHLILDFATITRMSLENMLKTG